MQNGQYPTGTGDLCPCHGEGVVDYEAAPKLYDVAVDPRELRPLAISSEVYDQVATEMLTDMRQFQENLDRTKVTKSIV